VTKKIKPRFCTRLSGKKWPISSHVRAAAGDICTQAKRQANRTTRPRPAVARTEVAAEGAGGGGELLAPGPLAGAGGDGEEPSTTSMAIFIWPVPVVVQWPGMPQMK
jgi:hypothetical protein